MSHYMVWHYSFRAGGGGTLSQNQHCEYWRHHTVYLEAVKSQIIAQGVIHNYLTNKVKPQSLDQCVLFLLIMLIQ